MTSLPDCSSCATITTSRYQPYGGVLSSSDGVQSVMPTTTTTPTIPSTPPSPSSVARSLFGLPANLTPSAWTRTTPIARVTSSQSKPVTFHISPTATRRMSKLYSNTTSVIEDAEAENDPDDPPFSRKEFLRKFRETHDPEHPLCKAKKALTFPKERNAATLPEAVDAEEDEERYEKVLRGIAQRWAEEEAKEDGLVSFPDFYELQSVATRCN